jgi:hypothetical protein
LTVSQEKIDQIKSQFPDRALILVEANDANDKVMEFIMTGPTRDELKFLDNKLTAAREIKDEADKMWAMRSIVENAALAQIRWPDREECKKAFEVRPQMVDGFHAELRKAAGADIELRSKKL